MINLSPFGLPSESKGHICEAPAAATLCWFLDRAGGKADTSEKVKTMQDKETAFPLTTMQATNRRPQLD